MKQNDTTKFGTNPMFPSNWKKIYLKNRVKFSLGFQIRLILSNPFDRIELWPLSLGTWWWFGRSDCCDSSCRWSNFALLYPKTPKIAMSIPKIFTPVTGLPKISNVTAMMKMRLLAFATANVSGVTRLSTENAKMFCNQFIIPSIISSPRIRMFASKGVACQWDTTPALSLTSQIGRNITAASCPTTKSNLRWWIPVSFNT